MTHKLMQGDSAELLKTLESESVDLTVTSPPYDNLRTYNGYTFHFEEIARQLYRVTKQGGVVVWIVGDATINGSETGTSFKQALFFKEIGFNLHDTMIWNKGGFSAVGALQTRYAPVFEYMFVFSKGKPKSFNPIKDRKNKHAGTFVHGTVRQKDGSSSKMIGHNIKVLPEFGQRFNVWDIAPHRQRGEFCHPAPFPESIAHDHIISWSNIGDTVLDPFLGSGTTGKCAVQSDRKFVGIDVSQEYVDMAKKRIESCMINEIPAN